jgi:DNA-binding protein HU-beta
MASTAKPLTKSQLITALSEKLDMSKKDVNTFLETLSDIACKETKKKDSFVLPGFGKLVKVNRKARKGRNPATGEEIQIKAKTVVKFRVAKACKDAIVPGKK